MKLKILPVIRSEKRNKFKLVIEFMHGDGDADSTVEQWLDSEQHVIDCVKMINRMRRVNEDNLLDKISGLLGTDLPKHISILLDNWPSDFTTEGEYLASLQKVNCYFYDEVGDVHSVSIDGKINL